MYISIRYASCNNTIDISDCLFTNNSASTLGGGLFAYFFDKTANNSLTLSNSIFNENRSPKGYGGAYVIGFECHIENEKECKNNSIHVDSCRFQNNRALYGGGLAFTSTRIDSQISKSSYNEVYHNNCTWMNNTAHYGAAIVVLPGSWSLLTMGAFPTPVFENCSLRSNGITENTIESLDDLQEPFHQCTMGAGTLYCTELHMTFIGTLILENNNGSAILGSSCSLTFQENSTATFIGNSGYVGGALHLVGYSTIYVSAGNSFSFHNNTAQTDGGAIFHQSSDIIEHSYSYNCFIARNGNADISSVEFRYSGNLAGTGNGQKGHGNSIYATSLKPCIREYGSFPNMLANFSGKDNEITSEVSRFSAKLSKFSSTSLPIIPGKYTKLNFEGRDDLLNERSAAYITTVRNHQNSNISSSGLSLFTVDNSIKLLGNPGDTATIFLSTLTKHKTVLSFRVKLEPCPPGFVLQEVENHSKGCVCSLNTDVKYAGIKSCNISHFYANRIRGYWAGYDERLSLNNDSSFITGYCPIGYCQYHTYQLPREASRDALNENVCKENREGVLCSKCKKNASAYFHSPSHQCNKQDLCYLGPLLYLASEIVPVTILFVLITTLNVSFSSGSLNGFILYAQVIGFFQVKINSRIKIEHNLKCAHRAILMLYEIFNLQFFNANWFSFCLFKNATVLDLLVFQYSTVFFSFLLVLLILLVFRFCNLQRIKSVFRCRVNSMQSSMIHGLSAFLVLCFAKCAHVSTVVLSYGFIRGKGEKVVKAVVYIYGEYEFFSLDHIKYVVPSLIIGIVMVVIPLVILLSYPLCFRCLAALKVRDKRCILALCKPIEKMKPFLDSFQGCYRDNCRFFAGLYFLYRILILLNYSLNFDILFLHHT